MGARGCTNNQPFFHFAHVPTAEQNKLLNSRTMLIPMIESKNAADRAAEILAVDGVDGLLVGSNDLCSDLGIHEQYDHEAYQQAVTKVVLSGKEAGKPVGIAGIAGRPDLLERWFAMGASWSLSGADLNILQDGMKKIGADYEAMNRRVLKAKAAASEIDGMENGTGSAL
ncbi:Pyruvate/Phosphoenolpyruvate kinase-like domain-containing protein [Xylariomycetidae sp. FL2044]|nr:Pyruvate/Phosphoenolpyruvate kinase-like domain-containing protein [Xylariomycetidae sp. FL2044]